MPSPPRLCSGSAKVMTAQVLTFCLIVTCFLKASSRPTCSKKSLQGLLPESASVPISWCSVVHGHLDAVQNVLGREETRQLSLMDTLRLQHAGNCEAAGAAKGTTSPIHAPQ